MESSEQVSSHVQEEVDILTQTRARRQSTTSPAGGGFLLSLHSALPATIDWLTVKVALQSLRGLIPCLAFGCEQSVTFKVKMKTGLARYGSS